jgi:hypothetical protein
MLVSISDLIMETAVFVEPAKEPSRIVIEVEDGFSARVFRGNLAEGDTEEREKKLKPTSPRRWEFTLDEFPQGRWFHISVWQGDASGEPNFVVNLLRRPGYLAVSFELDWPVGTPLVVYPSPEL